MTWQNILKTNGRPMTNEEKVLSNIKYSGSLGGLSILLTSMLNEGYNFQDNNKVKAFASILTNMSEGGKKGYALIPPTDEQIPNDLNIRSVYEEYYRTGNI
jgi:hypothetical protein